MRSRRIVRGLGILLGLLSVLLAGCGNQDADPLQMPIPAGLEIQDLYVASGPYPLSGQRVSINYTGSVAGGSTFSTNQPLTFQLGSGQVIQGLDFGVSTMKVGSRRKLTIPPNLAYGSTGAPPTIPANATLIYDLWLVAAQ